MTSDRCTHGKSTDDWCRRCVADKMADKRDAGFSYSRIASDMGYPTSTVRRWIDKWSRSSTVERRTFNSDAVGSSPAEITKHKG